MMRVLKAFFVQVNFLVRVIIPPFCQSSNTLALFMGHSLSMQKKSYDRRTLDQKVAPAVSLMRGLARGETAA